MSSTPTATTLAFSILKCSVNAMIIAFPAFQTFQILEGRRVQDAHHMLTYWCVQCVVHAAQNIADEMLGKYQLDRSYQSVCLLLKLAPIIVGPEKLYNMFVRPFFLKQEKTLDIVTNTAEHESEHAQKTLKQEGTVTQKLAHEVSHLKQSLKHAGKELIDRDTSVTPPSSSVDPTEIADALPSQPSNMTAQALSRWEQARESQSSTSTSDNDPHCPSPLNPSEPVTRCNMIHPLPKIQEEGVEMDEKQHDNDVKHQPIVRRRVH